MSCLSNYRLLQSLNDLSLASCCFRETSTVSIKTLRRAGIFFIFCSIIFLELLNNDLRTTTCPTANASHCSTMKKIKKILSSPESKSQERSKKKKSHKDSASTAAERYANRETDFEDYEIDPQGHTESTPDLLGRPQESAGEASGSQPSRASLARTENILREDNAFPSDLSALAERKPFDLSRVIEEDEDEDEDEAASGFESEEDLYGVSDDEAQPKKSKERSTRYADPPISPRRLRSPFELSRNDSRATASTTSLPSDTQSASPSRPSFRRQLTDSPTHVPLPSRSSLRNSSELPSLSQTLSGSPPRSPGYIHRVQTPTGTRYSLQKRSPSETGKMVPLEWAEGSSLMLKSTVEEMAREQAREEQLAHRRRAVKRSNTDRSDATSPGDHFDSSVSQPSAASPSPGRGHRRAGHSALRGDQLVAQVGIIDPNNCDATGSAFESSRHNVHSKKGKELIAKRKPTIAPSPTPTPDTMPPSTHASQTRYKTAEGEDPPRPSFEPAVFTAEEFAAYARIRTCYAAAIVLERAVVPLIDVYNGVDWPAGLKRPVNAETHSSLQWARQASALFRHEIKKDELYLKFQRNGNDIATRAKNDVVRTGGSLPEIWERIEDWSQVDREEGVQVIDLMRVREKDGAEGKESKAAEGNEGKAAEGKEGNAGQGQSKAG